MKYFTLKNSLKNQIWIKTKFDKSKKQIKLYDNNLKFKGTGLY